MGQAEGLVGEVRPSLTLPDSDGPMVQQGTGALFRVLLTHHDSVSKVSFLILQVRRSPCVLGTVSVPGEVLTGSLREASHVGLTKTSDRNPTPANANQRIFLGGKASSQKRGESWMLARS